MLIRFGVVGLSILLTAVNLGLEFNFRNEAFLRAPAATKSKGFSFKFATNPSGVEATIVTFEITPEKTVTITNAESQVLFSGKVDLMVLPDQAVSDEILSKLRSIGIEYSLGPKVNIMDGAKIVLGGAKIYGLIDVFKGFETFSVSEVDPDWEKGPRKTFSRINYSGYFVLKGNSGSIFSYEYTTTKSKTPIAVSYFVNEDGGYTTKIADVFAVQPHQDYFNKTGAFVLDQTKPGAQVYYMNREMEISTTPPDSSETNAVQPTRSVRKAKSTSSSTKDPAIDQNADGADEEKLSERTESKNVPPIAGDANKIKEEIKVRLSFRPYLKAMQESISAQALGQPEGVDALLDIELQNILNGNRRVNPEKVIFMGLPGTGKDTLAKAYIRARFAINYKKTDVRIQDHLFPMDAAKKPADIWAYTGVGSGYVGQDHVSPLIRFLVLHSGGKYRIARDENRQEIVLENPSWKSGMVLKGYHAPEDGVLFVNEFHDWNKQLKNDLLKEAYEFGFFKIGNPGTKGLSRIQVPITFITASNDGIGLISPRDEQGRRIGAPLTEVQLMERWRRAAKDSSALMEELGKPSPSNNEGGTSEEILSRFPKSRVVLLRPMTREDLIKVTKKKLLEIADKFQSEKSMNFPKLRINFSARLIDFIATYNQLPEDGARVIDNKIETLVSNPLIQAVVNKSLSVKDGDTLNLDIKTNEDGTFSLTTKNQEVPIEFTERSRKSRPITDEEIDRLNTLEDELNKRVKGVKEIVRHLVTDIKLTANSERPQNPDLETKLADIYAFLGVSSTGKTELARALHQVLYKTNTEPLIIDFSRIQTVRQLEEKILGFRDSANRAVFSDFMNEYDRLGGEMVVVLDELTNARPEVLTALYDFLRVPVMRTFSDGKPRPMGRVKIVATGNLGEEWYQDIPREAPEIEQYEAARKIYDTAMANGGFRRNTVTAKLTDAFYNRVGGHRIYFFPPHTPATIRDLIQLNLISSLKEFSKPSFSKRTWDVRFASAEDYKRTVEAIEAYGFKLWEQGASIKNFIDQILIPQIHEQLLSNKISDRAQVNIAKSDNKISREGVLVGLSLKVADRTLEINLKGKPVPKPLKTNPSETLLTAYHEAGHEVVNHILLGDKYRSAGISILPGMTEINGRMVQFEGIAQHEQVENYSITPEIVISKIAVMMAGEAAEQLTTKNSRHTAGKANDLQRATLLAQKAILNWGLSEKWGRRVIGPDKDINSFVATLPQAKKKILDQEVWSLIERGRELAKDVLIANYEHIFMPVGQHLAGRGEIAGPTLERFYQQRNYLIVHPNGQGAVRDARTKFEALKAKESAPQNLRDFEFYSFVKRPQIIIDVQNLRQVTREKELAQVDLSPGRDVIRTNRPKKVGPSGGRSILQMGMSCKKLFL